MKQEIVYSCKGDPTMQDEYMDFINYVFGFNGNGSDFYKLLPKLYKKEYNPCGNSYVVIDGGRIVEQGTHNELIEKGGVYKKLYESQFADDIELDVSIN